MFVTTDVSVSATLDLTFYGGLFRVAATYKCVFQSGFKGEQLFTGALLVHSFMSIGQNGYRFVVVVFQMTPG